MKNKRHLQYFPSTYQGADKSLARPGRKQATATKLWLLQTTQKKLRRSSFQPGLRRNNDFRVGRIVANFQLFFSRVGLRTFQHLLLVLFLFQFIFRHFWVRELSKMQLTSWLNIVTVYLSFYTRIFGLCFRNSQSLSLLILSKPRCNTVSLNPWNRVLLKKLTDCQLVKKFSAIYGIRRFITAFTSSRQMSLS
jgi:hypothetical protein